MNNTTQHTIFSRHVHSLHPSSLQNKTYTKVPLILVGIGTQITHYKKNIGNRNSYIGNNSPHQNKSKQDD